MPEKLKERIADLEHDVRHLTKTAMEADMFLAVLLHRTELRAIGRCVPPYPEDVSRDPQEAEWLHYILRAYQTGWRRRASI